MSRKPACMGLDMANRAGNLSDLLFASPAAWGGKPMLRYRSEDGRWHSLTRGEVQKRVLRIAAWLQSQGVHPGDRVGILGHNSPHWLMADFAILSLGAVTVPAYFTDPLEAVHYVLEDSGCKLVLVEPTQQEKLSGLDIPDIPFFGDAETTLESISQDSSWDGRDAVCSGDRDKLATLIYTSGTTGNPKGVMLTHGNLLSDVEAGLGGVPIFPSDIFLSFLPLSHAFERTVGHFLAVASGSEIAYAEDVTTLMRDMPEVKPTVMISVPRLYEKIYAGVHEKVQQGPAVKRWLFGQAQAIGAERFALRQHGRDLGMLTRLLWKLLDHLVNEKLREKMGGNLRLFVSGGAALSPTIARFLLAANITVLPGYGLTEASPVLTVNTEKRIKPDSIGPALPGVELRLGEEGELCARGEMVMQGYWNKPEETAEAVDAEGWLHTGDIAEIDADGFVYIIGRKKELMVLSNGENVPPALVEQHLAHDPCILQAMVVGEGQPFAAALIVSDKEMLPKVWQREKGSSLPRDWRTNSNVHDWLLARMQESTHDLPSFMQVERFMFVNEEWTQDNGLLTPTLKLKRPRIEALHKSDIQRLFDNA